jgi:flagellar protein FliS
MNTTDSYKKYRQTQIKTADPGTLILILYDGAILALKKAHKLMAARPLNREALTEQIIKAKNIIYELTAALDLEKGGDIAKSLLDLYGYFIRRIGKADLTKDPLCLEDVLTHLENLRSAWTIVFQNARAQKQGTEISSNPLSLVRSSEFGVLS